MKIKKILLLAIISLVIPNCWGQLDHYLQIKEVSVATPGRLCNFSVVDGRLYAYGAGMMLSSDLVNGEPSQFEADLALLTIDKEMDYVVKNPSNNRLYYTKHNSKGYSTLWECIETPGKKMKIQQVKLQGVKMSIEHPTFTTDGRMMIFVSSDKGVGSYDLWCSVKHGEKWGTPQNLGKRVNSQGDEVMPYMIGDYLLFSSKGRPEKYGGYNIYATRLLALRQNSDTVSMLPIGQSNVIEMPAPFNSEDDDVEMVALPDGKSGLWMRANDNSVKMFRFNGLLTGVKFSGKVIGKGNTSLSNVKVDLVHYGQVIESQTTGTDGEYCFYVAPNKEYELRFMCRNYFENEVTMTSNRPNEESLIVEKRKDVVLGQIALNTPQIFTEIFEDGASIDISNQGKNLLQPIVKFLKDNPHLKSEVVVWSDLTTDKTFNMLLSGKRLESVKEYLEQDLYQGTSIIYENGCDTNDGCANSSGVTTLSIMVFDDL